MRRLFPRIAPIFVVACVGLLGWGGSASADVNDTQTTRLQTIYAAFEQSDSGSYTIDIGAHRDVVHGTTAAQARGEVDGAEDLYYFAYAVSPAIRFEVSGSLLRAHLDASVIVQYCFDKDGIQVDTPLCPLGKSVALHAVLTATTRITKVVDNRGADGFTLLLGRLASATATQDGHDLGTSQYAEIVYTLDVTR